MAGGAGIHRAGLLIPTLAGGSVAELTYLQAQASGTAEAAVRVTNRRLTITGRTVDGQAIEESIDLAHGERVACEMTACLIPMLSGMDGCPSAAVRPG